MPENQDLQVKLDQALAVAQLYRDLLENKKQDYKAIFIALIISLMMNLGIVGAFLWYDSGWTYTDTTTTTTEQYVDGDNGSIVNGDQYNDQAQNRSGGE